MVGVMYGTPGDLIKVSPLMVKLIERGTPAFTICTGQQVEQISPLLAEFGLPTPSLWLAHGHNGHDLQRPTDVLPWVLAVMSTFARRRQALRGRLASASTKPLLIIHGDTFTAVLGALMGHALRIPVAHIEAGVRSGNWRHPFPEEAHRALIARLSHIYFAPGEPAVANLHAMKVRGEIVDTISNTTRDALALVRPESLEIELPSEPFGLVSLRRFELLSKPAAFRSIIELLHDVSRSTPLLFVDHPVTAASIETNGLEAAFDARFRRVPRQRYFRFIALLRASAFLVTDSGGAQQECAELGHPCLVHRVTTEQIDGLNESIVLSGMDLDVVRSFLADPRAHARPAARQHERPTDVIIEYLERCGYTTAPVAA